MKKLFYVTVVVLAAVAIALPAGCEKKKPNFAPTAKAIGNILSDAFADNTDPDKEDTAFGANPLVFSDPNEVKQAGFDTEALGVGDFGQTGGINDQAVQTEQLESAYGAMEQSPETAENGTWINPLNGHVTEYFITWSGGNVTITTVTTGFLLFVDNVTALISIDTNSTPLDGTDDELLAFNYTVNMKNGAVHSVTALDPNGDGYIVQDDRITIESSATALPGFFGFTSIIDRMTVDTGGTMDDETDDEVVEWSRAITYSNGMYQYFVLLDEDNNGHLIDSGLVHMNITTNTFPAETDLDEVVDDFKVQIGDIDNASDDELFSWERTVTFVSTTAVLTIATRDVDNDGIIINNGVVELVITATGLPDEERPAHTVTLTEYIKYDTKRTLDGTDDEVLDWSVSAISTSGGSFLIDVDDTDGDGSLTTGSPARTTVSIVATPPTGETDSSSFELEIVIDPQGTEDDSDDLYVSFSLTDNRRNGSMAQLTITASPPFAPGVQPDSATVTFYETRTNGNPKIDATMTFLADGSATGVIKFYTLAGVEHIFDVTITVDGTITAKERK